MPKEELLIGTQPAKLISNQVSKTTLNTVFLHTWRFRNVSCQKWDPHSAVDVVSCVQRRGGEQAKAQRSFGMSQPPTWRHRVTSHTTWIPHC